MTSQGARGEALDRASADDEAVGTAADATAPDDSAAFYASLPRFERFEAIADPATYAPLPADWWVGMSDIVASTAALAQGRYKAVNVAGASIIAALTNALPGRPFPFVFGGDGASFAIPACDEPVARTTLASTAAWVRDDLGLAMRAALIPLQEVRAANRDVRVARYAASADVSFAMFAGGGLAWAERALKDGRHAVEPAPAGTRPNLAGLSCRWNDIPSRHGVVLSLIVAPAHDGDPRFRALVESVLGLLADSRDVARPVPDEAPGISWPPPGLDLEARASRSAREPVGASRIRVGALTLAAYLVMRAGIRIGGFDPAVYRAGVVANSDFRKYDDQLRMTVDCSPAVADRVERALEAAGREGVARFGAHRQDAAIMTCFVPRVEGHDHVHFVDGAAGGYAAAARRIKSTPG